MKLNITHGTPHDYQLEAYRFGLKRQATYIMTDPGAGKTLISLMFLRKLERPAFVFAPLRVCYDTWPAEIQKWYPGLSYTILHGRKKDKNLRKNVWVYIINYEGLPWLYKQCCNRNMILRKYPVIFDESTYIKEPSTARFKYLKSLMPLFSRYRMNLSGTPAPTGLHNLWSQYYVLDEGATLGKSYTPFRDTYFVYTGPPYFRTTIKSPWHEQEIHRLIDSRTYRLEADKIPVKHITHKVSMSDSIAEQYRTFLTEAELTLKSGTNVAAMSELMQRSKLRQFIQGGLYTDSQGHFEHIHSTKLDVVRKIVSDENQLPAMILINFKFELKLLQNIFGDIPFITGATTGSKSVELIRAWNNNEIPILIAHPRSVKFGLNMQMAGRSIIWHALPSSPDAHLQVINRIARQGRPKHLPTVQNHHIILKDTIDENILPVLKNRYATQNDLFEAVRKGLQR